MLFQVFFAWNKDKRCRTLPTQTVIEHVAKWVERGFIQNRVWQDIQELVDFDLPRTERVTPPGQRTTSTLSPERK